MRHTRESQYGSVSSKYSKEYIFEIKDDFVKSTELQLCNG